MPRKQKLILNITSSVLFEISMILYGFILPRLIIRVYGSEVNGLVNSIAQFLQIINFLDLGMSAVVQSALYKPLVCKDFEEVSKVISSAQKFFRWIAQILFVYVLILIAVYPLIAQQNFGWVYTAILIAAMSISYFAQYYFGVVDRLLLIANQEGYIPNFIGIVSTLLNTFACVVIIQLGTPIYLVKLTASMVYLVRPFLQRLYVRRHYAINRKIKYEGEPIKQKWNGIAQHISYVILTSTDNIVLSIFSTLSNVSIYSVYHLVINGILQLFNSLTNGIRPILGELWAKGNIEKLNEIFGMTEWIIHTITVFMFTCTWKLILPFVRIYTNKVIDAEYIQPLFAAVLVIAYGVHCFRTPYNMLILATGAYKESQRMHVISAAINLICSVALVHRFGLIGVAVGTLIAMLYQTVWMIIFDSKNNICWPIKNVLLLIVFDAVSIAVIILTMLFVKVNVSDFFEWFAAALEVAFISASILFVMSMIFYKSYVVRTFHMLKRTRKKI